MLKSRYLIIFSYFPRLPATDVNSDRHQCGVNPVVVHGGGPQIAAMLERLQIPTSFVEVGGYSLGGVY